MKHPKPDSAVLSRKGDVALVPKHTENNRTSRTQLLNSNNQRSNIQNWVKVAGQHQYLLEKNLSVLLLCEYSWRLASNKLVHSASS